MLRILSDLHVYDDRSLVRDLRLLEPLLAGVQTLLLNGDSCEMRRGVGAEQIGEMKDFFRTRVPEVVFLTGNHDPEISETHELLLAGGRVWVTHGDICFEDVTPWSRKQPELHRTVQALLAADPSARSGDLTARLHLARAATRIVGNDIDPSESGLRAQAARFLHTFFPPRQPLAMLRAWRDFPQIAAALAAAQRPSAQVVVMGHVHFPGVWVRPPGPTVVNTGSFFRPLGGSLVDLSGDAVHVRKISRRCGRFHPGRSLAVIPLTRADAGGVGRG